MVFLAEKHKRQKIPAKPVSGPALYKNMQFIIKKICNISKIFFLIFNLIYRKKVKHIGVLRYFSGVNSMGIVSKCRKSATICHIV
jgi:hypothetical protein